MLKLPEYFSLFAIMKEDGAIEVEADTAEEDGSIKNGGIIVATLAAIFDYCVRHSHGHFTRDSLLAAVHRHMNDPDIHREITNVDPDKVDELRRSFSSDEYAFDSDVKMPKFVM